MYNQIIIVCNGEDYTEKKLVKLCNEADYIIAADGGFNILNKFNVTPDLIIGDMDSINKNKSSYDRIKKITFSKNKDLTDSELSIQHALSLKPNKIFLLASTGSYYDHSLANIINLLRNYSESAELKIITENCEIFGIKKNKEIINAIGRRCSFFPIGEVKNISLNGFKYRFKKKVNISSLDYSISNVIVENKAVIKFDEGMIICFLFDYKYK